MINQNHKEMRDILFRGKRINNVTKEYEFVYGCYLKQASKINGKTREVEEWKHYIVNVYGDKLRVIPKTVGQYTGLKDKEGNKIFEGDILLECGDAVIVRIGKPFNEFIKTIMVYGEMDDGSTWIFEHDEDWKILGNIHDNPELLQ